MMEIAPTHSACLDSLSEPSAHLACGYPLPRSRGACHSRRRYCLHVACAPVCLPLLGALRDQTATDSFDAASVVRFGLLLRERILGKQTTLTANRQGPLS